MGFGRYQPWEYKTISITIWINYGYHGQLSETNNAHYLWINMINHNIWYPQYGGFLKWGHP